MNLSQFKPFKNTRFTTIYNQIFENVTPS